MLQCTISLYYIINIGQDLGNYINQYLLDNDLVVGETGQILITLKDLKAVIIKSPYHSFLAKIGTSDTSSAANGLVCAGNLGTTIFSCIRSVKTTSTPARVFYLGSALCGTGGAVTSGISSIGRSCQLNASGGLSLSASQVFYRAGNYLHNQALKAEGKLSSPRITSLNKNSKGIFSSNRNSKGLAFTMPDHYESVSFVTLLKGTIVIISIYSYVKLVLSSYKRGKKWLTSDNKKGKQSEFILQKANYSCQCLVNSKSVSSILHVWSVVNYPYSNYSYI